MNNRCMAGKCPGSARNAVVKSCADGKEDITILNGHIGCVTAVDAKVTYIQIVGAGNRTFPHDGSDNGNTCDFHKL